MDTTEEEPETIPIPIPSPTRNFMRIIIRLALKDKPSSLFFPEWPNDKTSVL